MGSLAAGQVLAGRYRLVAPLGRGAMGEVWRAEHVSLGAPVAVKVIVDAGFDEANPMREELLTRFFREAQAAAALRSPHVVQILDHGVDGGIPYIAMELLEGETLEQRLDRINILPHGQTAEFVTHIARAISKAHEAGIVHRDLKPGNVFLVRNDDEEIAKVLDFGIAKITPTAGFEEGAGGVATRTGSVVGTPCYMSPEQALGNKTIDSRSDLWSLAVIAFECVVGRRPFDSEAFGDLIVQICARPIPVPSKMGPAPDGFDAWFAKAACREVEGRFQSARELADALRMVLAPETVSVRMRYAQASQPAIRLSLLEVGAQPDAFAQTAAHQLTNAGVVSAITPPPKKRKSALMIGAAALLVAASAAVIAIAGKSSNPPVDPAQASAPSTSVAPLGAPTSKPAQGLGAMPGGAATVGPDTTQAVGSVQPDGPAVNPAVSGTPAASATPSSTGKPAGSTKAPPSGGSVKPKTPTVKKPPDRLGF
jgi:eukaryotic-like serine/threonine-protein kinase